MTQFCELNFGDIIASTSTTPLEVKVDEEIIDPCPMHYANYSKILHDQKVMGVA